MSSRGRAQQRHREAPRRNNVIARPAQRAVAIQANRTAEPSSRRPPTPAVIAQQRRGDPEPAPKRTVRTSPTNPTRQTPRSNNVIARPAQRAVAIQANRTAEPSSRRPPTPAVIAQQRRGDPEPAPQANRAGQPTNPTR